jgi:hypothetical protein
MNKSIAQVRLPISNKAISLIKFANATSIVGGLATAAFHAMKQKQLARCGALFDECKALRDECDQLYRFQVETDYISSPFASWGPTIQIALDALHSSNIEALTVLRDGYLAAKDELITGAAIAIIEKESAVH